MNMAIKIEEKAKILESLPGMAFRCSYDPPNFPFVYVSEGCEAVTEYLPEELTDANGIRLMDIVHPNDTLELIERHEATLSIGAPLETSFRIKTKSGLERCVLIRSRVSQTDSVGMPYIIEGLLTDITKQLQIETLRQGNQEGSDFWTKVGHDIRTPMNAILGLTELGLRADMPGIVRDYTLSVKKAGEKLMSTLNNIMDYTKLTRGELEIITGEYTLSALVDDIAGVVKEQARDVGLDFAVYIDSTIPDVLMGDAARLRQIILNILSNAVKFTDRGYISLSIDGAVQEGTANLVITIEDTGHGIKEEDFNRLFKEFNQFDEKNIEGGGLGLVIARNLVRLMGGDIQTSSMYGVGSVFTITVPQFVHSATAPTPEIKVNNPEDINVLIFERRKVCKSSVMRTLKNLKVNCTAVATVEELYEELQSGQYSFVFTACVLHDEFRQKYQGYKTNAKIVLMAERGEVAQHSEDVMVLTKPIFYLPVLDILNGTYSENRPTHTTARFTAPTAKVLIVDDVSANLVVAEGLLQPYNMQLDMCESGADAIERVKANNYDLVLMDYRMPVMDGIQTTLTIRALPEDCQTDCKNVPIIALTANTEHSNREMFQQNGFSDFLPKPIEILGLHAAMEKWIPKAKQEKLSKSVAASLAESNTTPEPDFKIEGIDVKKGIGSTGGNQDIYLRVISKYHENGIKLLNELEEYVTTGNIEMYRIRVHALNNLSASIGAYAVSKLAATLENAAEQDDMELIKAENSKFLQELNTLLQNIHPHIIKESESRKMDTARDPNEKQKILIIDDTDAYLLILNDILKDDYETIIAMDGEDGLDTARLTMPDLILLDIVMPGMSGYDVLKEMRNDKALKSIPVILISGKTSDQNEIKGYTLGAAGYIKKPFEKDVIKDKIKTILGGV